MAKWTFHRPATKDVQRASHPTIRANPSRRWTFAPIPEVAPPMPPGSAWFLMEHEGVLYWHCDYGCKCIVADRVMSDAMLNTFHAYDCDYWYEEGIDQTPF